MIGDEFVDFLEHDIPLRNPRTVYVLPLEYPDAATTLLNLLLDKHEDYAWIESASTYFDTQGHTAVPMLAVIVAGAKKETGAVTPA